MNLLFFVTMESPELTLFFFPPSPLAGMCLEGNEVTAGVGDGVWILHSRQLVKYIISIERRGSGRGAQAFLILLKEIPKCCTQ